MKKRKIYSLINVLSLFFFFSITLSFAQEKSKKQLKEENELKQQNQINLLINSKKFIFKAETVVPQGGSVINLTDYYTVEFHSDYIKSELPFFGIGYTNIGYGGENGMRFEGKPNKFSIEKTKKYYVLDIEVKVEQDSYSLLLSIYFDGSAYLSINSINRSFIAYRGNIKPIDNK